MSDESQQPRTYDPREGEKEKARSREADEKALAEGHVSPEDLQHQNSFIPREIAQSAKIVRWKKFR